MMSYNPDFSSKVTLGRRIHQDIPAEVPVKGILLVMWVSAMAFILGLSKPQSVLKFNV
jgi:hypothetical protein